jgi:hypothetical protein
LKKETAKKIKKITTNQRGWGGRGNIGFHTGAT